MKLFEVVEVLNVPAGVELELSEQQAARRAHLLEHVEGKRYRASGKLQFKVGEQIRIDVALLGKGKLSALEDPQEVAERKAGEKKAGYKSKGSKNKDEAKPKAAESGVTRGSHLHDGENASLIDPPRPK